MGRVFQDARLFGDLTVAETIRLALEHGSGPSSCRRCSASALPPRRAAQAGTGCRGRRPAPPRPVRPTPIADLSTGTRRIVELACQIALESTVLLLDEPTAGVAQKDAEAFGPLIQQVRADLDATVVLIEHDLPLVLSVSDRVYCLGAGRSSPREARTTCATTPRWSASYLGTDERAIFRSGAAAGQPSWRRRDDDGTGVPTDGVARVARPGPSRGRRAGGATGLHRGPGADHRHRPRRRAPRRVARLAAGASRTGRLADRWPRRGGGRRRADGTAATPPPAADGRRRWLAPPTTRGPSAGGRVQRQRRRAARPAACRRRPVPSTATRGRRRRRPLGDRACLGVPGRQRRRAA